MHCLYLALINYGYIFPHKYIRGIKIPLKISTVHGLGVGGREAHEVFNWCWNRSIVLVDLEDQKYCMF